MSRNVRLTTSLRIAPQVQQLMCLATADLCFSAELCAAAAMLTVGSPIPAAVVPFLTDPRLARLADHAGAEHAARLQDLLPRLSEHDAGAAASLLGGLRHHLAVLERSAVTALTVDTMTDLGYTVDHERGEHADGIEAWAGDELVLIAVTDGGEMLFDHAGVDGACADRQAQVEDGLRHRGLTITRAGRTAHEQEVRPLIATAAGAGQPSLAAAIARGRVAAEHTARRAADRTRNRQRPAQLAGEGQ